ncbi:sulfite oxidase [SAR202 cluster bacterium AD-804-J14_MRT_500m]|nr:sulfite oxidase [SAR202 cluster bacterium AD-804-J14_MRT_500m]
MASPQTRTQETLQLIPTNPGGRTFSTPPQGLQPRITPNEIFYIRNHWKDVPNIDVDTYRLIVDGEVEHDLNLSMEQIYELPKKRFEVTMECCGNGFVPENWGSPVRSAGVMESVTGHGIMSNADWAGVALVDVLDMAGIKPSAVEALFEGSDHGPDEIGEDPPDVTYERSLPMSKAMHPDTLLAYEMNGVPLPPDHGFPLRLLVPGWYGMCSIKWLAGIHILNHEFKGFYQTQRYMTINGPDAPTFYTFHTQIKVKSIITNPAPGETVTTGRVTLKGRAWSGEKQIVKVDVSTDGGGSWEEARLHPRRGYSWYEWEFDWSPQVPGQYIVMSRATNIEGLTQPMDFPNKWDGLGYGNNMVFSHTVDVVNP